MDALRYVDAHAVWQWCACEKAQSGIVYSDHIITDINTQLIQALQQWNSFQVYLFI